jgi:hypothetical protein
MFDCFSAGLVLKWIFAGKPENIPYQTERDPEKVRRQLTELSKSPGCQHPFVQDLSDVNERVRETVQVVCRSFQILNDFALF